MSVMNSAKFSADIFMVLHVDAALHQSPPSFREASRRRGGRVFFLTIHYCFLPFPVTPEEREATRGAPRTHAPQSPREPDHRRSVERRWLFQSVLGNKSRTSCGGKLRKFSTSSSASSFRSQWWDVWFREVSVVGRFFFRALFLGDILRVVSTLGWSIPLARAGFPEFGLPLDFVLKRVLYVLERVRGFSPRSWG